MIKLIQNSLSLNYSARQHPPGFLVGLAAAVTSNTDNIKYTQSVVQPLTNVPIVDANIIVQEHKDLL